MTRTRTIPKDESEKAAGRKPEVMLRIVSAVVLAALALAATWFSPWSFLVLVMVGGGLIAWEWGRLTRGNGFDGTALISAVAVTAVYSFVVSFVILKALDLVMGVRVSEDKERIGLDLTEHREAAYTIID